MGQSAPGGKSGRGTKGQMARGFWTGLVHGGIVSVLAVAALSLAVPLPREAGPAQDTPAAAALPPAVPDEDRPAARGAARGEAIPPAQNRPAAEARQPSDSAPSRPEPEPPAAAAVDLPVGSEFGRGGDAVPVVPEPLVSGRPDPAQPPAVIAPESEPAPVAATPSDRRPDPAPNGNGPVQVAPDLAEDLPQIRPAASAAPSRPSALTAPGRAAPEAPDAAPALPADLLPAPRDPSPPEPETPTAAPAPDLSLPPDLSDLQGLSND